MYTDKRIKKNEILLIISIFILSVILISPLLSSGFVGDDAPNSLTKGHLLEKNRSSVNLTTQIMSDWIHIGRFYPLAGWTYMMFNVFSNLLAYKLSVLFFIICNLVLFYYFVRNFTRSSTVALFSLSLVPLIFQFRIFHDPILSFGWLLQVVFLYTFGSLTLLVLYIKHQKRYFYILSLVIYTVSLFTYEITYPFFLLHFVVTYFKKDRKLTETLKIGLPYCGLALFAILVSVAIRIYFKVPLSGASSGPYVPNFNLVINIKTFIKQTSAAFPLSYYYFDPLKVFSGFSDYIKASKMNFILLIGYIFIAFSLGRQAFKERCITAKNVIEISVIGALVLLLPGLLISLSTGYQSQVMLGVGYLPVYISYFGLAMIISCLLVFIYQKLEIVHKYLSISFLGIIALILSYTAIISYNNNRIVVENLNSGWLYPRTIIETALENGLFKKLPKNSIVLVDSNYPWDVSSFYTMNSGKKVRYLGAKGAYDLSFIDFNKQYQLYDNPAKFSFSNNQNVYYLRYLPVVSGKGIVLLGKIKSMLASKTELKRVDFHSAFLYADYLNLSDEPIDVVIKRTAFNGNLLPGRNYQNLKTKNLDDNWVIYSLAFQDGTKKVDLSRHETAN